MDCIGSEIGCDGVRPDGMMGDGFVIPKKMNDRLSPLERWFEIMVWKPIRDKESKKEKTKPQYF